MSLRSLMTTRQCVRRCAARITRAKNRQGVIDSLQTLDAERTLAEAQSALSDQDAFVSQRQIGLFRALGGGWSATATESPT